MLSRLLVRGMIFRAKFVDKLSKKKTRKVLQRLPPNEQFFVNGLEPFVWKYDPVTYKTVVLGVLLGG